MPTKPGQIKAYAAASYYESKLSKVMKRLGVSDFNWDHSRHEAWIEFRYKGNPYRFSRTVTQARATGQRIAYGSDCFAQLVLGLEDLARLVNRGIYDLQTWISGMKALPQYVEVPSCVAFFGFREVPSLQALHAAYRDKAPVLHPDTGGNQDDFNRLQAAYDQAKAFIGEKEV